MTRLLRALCWMRWRSAINAIARTGRRGRARKVSGWLEAGATAIVVTFALLTALALAAAAFGMGMIAASRPEMQSVMGLLIRLLGLAVLIMAFVSPLQGGGPGRAPTRLLLLPVPARALHVAGLLASLGEPLVVLSAPAVLALPLGMIAGGAAAAAAPVLLASLVLVAFLVGLDALVGFATQVLLRDRRRGEQVALVGLLLLMCAGFLPALVAHRLDDTEKAVRAGASPAPVGAPAESMGASVRDMEQGFGAADLLPPGLYARTVQRALDGRPGAALLHVAGLALMAALTIAAAVTVHARLLREPGQTSRRRLPASFPGREAWRPVFVSASTVALAEVTLRTTLRTIKGKLATLTPALVAALTCLMLRGLADIASLLGATMGSATGIFSWALTIAVLNQQQIVLNVLAADRSGLTLTFLMPVSEVQIVRAKLLAMGGLSAVALAPAVPVALIIGTPVPLAWWVTTLACALATILLHGPVAVALSALFPKPTDLSKMSGQQPHGAASLLGVVSLLLALAAPRAAAFGGSALAGPWGGAAAALIWCLACAALVAPMARLAADLVVSRREAIALAATGR